MAEVGSAFVSIVPTMKGAGSKIQSELDGSVGKAGKSAGSKFGGAFKGAAAAAIGAVALAKAIGFVKDAVSEARESQKVGAKTTAIIKATGGAAKISANGVNALSNSISNKVGVDDEAIQAGANLLLTFKRVRNEAGKGNDVFNQATRAAVDLSAAGFGSIDSASKQLGKALQDPVRGTMTLTRAGVQFTDQQKAQVKALVKSGDILGAQKVILGEVQSQVGGVASASATSGEKMSVAFKNFKESIGTALIPTIDAVNVKLTALFGWMQSHQGVVTAIAIVVGGVLVGAFLALAVAVIAATWPFLLLGVGLAALAVLWVILWKKSDLFRTMVKAIGVALLGLAANFLNLTASIAGTWAKMLGALSKAPGFGWAKGAAKALKTVADGAKAGADKANDLADKLKRIPKNTKADVKTPKLKGPAGDVLKLGDNIKKLPATKKAEVKVNSLKTPISETRTLKSHIDLLKSKTITITTNYKTTGTKPASTKPRVASGSIISGATRIIAGEAGREAIVPLDRPLNMVDPSVRWLAAFAQGKTDLSSMAPASLDSLGGISGDSGKSTGPIPVHVVNVSQFDDRSATIANGVVSDESAFAGAIGRTRR